MSTATAPAPTVQAAPDPRGPLIALHRFGLGARPGEFAEAARDPRGYVHAQLADRNAAMLAGTFPTSGEAGRRFVEMRQAGVQTQEADTRARRERLALAAQGVVPGQEGKADPVAPGPEERPRQLFFVPEVEARTHRMIETRTGFVERLVGFWTNHFAISARKSGLVAMMVGAFEREAIRPFVFGRFHDMLVAAETHPAMILYLDNERSVGPNSRAGQARGRSINENLAREILELHTLGVDGGYTQADVTTFARVLTGWTVVPAREENGATFVFRPNTHEPGAKTLLGRTYPAEGEGQGRRVLADLAVHPSTARHLARKLAAHFVADTPPPALVTALADAFRRTGGDLSEVYRVLVTHEASWSAPLSKFRTPVDYVVAAFRAIDFKPQGQGMIGWMNAMGQPVYAPPSPKGFPDDTPTWMTPDALRTRLDWASAMGNRFGGRIDATARLDQVLGASGKDELRTALRRAESRQQALTLLLMSPEFQRR